MNIGHSAATGKSELFPAVWCDWVMTRERWDLYENWEDRLSGEKEYGYHDKNADADFIRPECLGFFIAE